MYVQLDIYDVLRLLDEEERAVQVDDDLERLSRSFEYLPAAPAQRELVEA